MSVKTIILCGVYRPEEKNDFLSELEEDKALCAAADKKTAGVLLQCAHHPDPRMVLRAGKIAELKQLCEEKGAQQIVFAHEITPGQAERIREACGVEVIDRTAVLLEIFSRHARTRQAHIQTEMAWLLYERNRHRAGKSEREERSSGSFQSRGSGESTVNLLRRTNRRRYAALSKQLDLIRKQKGQDERRRAKTLLKRAAIVGYTNAGKSSFLNRMIESGSKGNVTKAQDALFVTLDTSVRKVRVDHYGFFLYDTVGFVSNLPDALLDAFRSTLEAACDADLLIHVLDASDPDWQTKEEAVEMTLKRIGADHIPVLRVFNKCDQPHGDLPHDAVCVSCLKGKGIEEAGKEIIKRLYPKEAVSHVLIPYGKIDTEAAYREVLDIKVLEDTDEGRKMELAGEKKYLDAFRPYVIRKENM